MTTPIRVLLVSPPSAAPNRIPLLNLLYLAAALRRAGADVMLLDLDDPVAQPPNLALLASVDHWLLKGDEAIDQARPALLGVTLCSETALAAYQLLAELGPRSGMTTVAGGSHATAVPDEVLDHGFDVVVRGEGEATIVELVVELSATARETSFSNIAGLSYYDDGRLVETPERVRQPELDELAAPTDVLDLIPRPSTLGASEASGLVPTILTSRGCPARCTFCANQVHGRKYRYHSNARVLEEIEAWYLLENTTVFNFCDAAFSVHQKRLWSLCEAFESLSFKPTWWCEARADQLNDRTVEAMAKAGCTTVMVGAESGDSSVLERVQKGVDQSTIARALECAKRGGLRTEVSFMVGFPDETASELGNTLAFMREVSQWVDIFRPMGIVVPYPGTPLYEEHHERCGFTKWWLDEERSVALTAAMNGLEPCQSYDDLIDMHAQMEQAFLDVHPIPYAPDVYDAIQRCLVFRREHNLRILKG